jgi:DNA replication protein DnaC
MAVKTAKTINHEPKSLMVLGTGSGVGKSIITAALCRYFYRKGRKVAPLKPRIWLIIHLSPGMRVK